MSELEKTVSAAEEAVENTLEEKKTDKAKKPAKKKRSIFARIGRWFKDLVGEAKKVVWPTGKQVVNNTVVVIIVVIIVAAIVYVLDVTFGGIRDFIARLV
ncbi:MAG: preprotein translocase subunit SecE [Clostridia bacterium]|nr:preprotein translocase subunit SecE [Clostridia bacterium]